MPLIKAKLEKGKLKAKIKYPSVGKAEIELITVNRQSKLKALVKVPFIFSAKLFSIFKLKKEGKKDEKEKG